MVSDQRGEPPEHLVTDPDHSIPIAVPYLTPGGTFGHRLLEWVALHHGRAMLFFFQWLKNGQEERVWEQVASSEVK